VIQIRTTFICNDGDYFLRHRRQVADALARAGHNVTVIAGGPPMSADNIGDWRYVNLQIERFAFHPVSDTRLILSSLREIARTRPENVQLITLKPAIFSGLAAIASRLLGYGPRRIVITIPGLGRLMSPGSAHDGRRARISRALVGRAIRFLSRRKDVYFTFETPTDRQHWLSLGYIRPEKSVAIAGAGVDPARFYPAGGHASRAVMRVLFASRLLRAKGLDAFVEAARRLHDRARIEFVVAGMVEAHDPDGYPPEELALERSITFLGEATDMPALLREVDLVCLPTRYGEGIPRILIEAAATGLPSIASDVDGCTHIVEHGVSGTIIPVSSPEKMADDLTDAVARYLANPDLRRRQGAAALAHFRQGEFTEDAVTGRIIALLTGD
jgi:glycosyltransferase involved in cell wall biosynthesis